MSLIYNKLINGIRRQLFDPAYCSISKSCFINYWKVLEKNQFLSELELRKIQWERLIDTLNFVEVNNLFYKERFNQASLIIADIRTPEDLLKLPILTKEEVRTNTDKMISRGFERDALMLSKTGGSTGKPLKLYITEECSEMRNACARRHDRWSGWEIGEPVGAVWGNPILPTTIKAKLKNFLLSPTIYLDTMMVNEASVLEFARQWEATKPTMLFGHAHSIFLLAEMVKKLNIKIIRPKAIISSSMMLIPSERDEIEEVFGRKVFDRYGCEEVSLIASECKYHKGMHLNIEHLFIEFVKDDGTYAKSGEPGRIIVTDLMNKAMPFIRYQVEDVGIPTDRKCRCGRGLPLMEQVEGRLADFLIRRDGTRIAGVSTIENTLTKFSGLAQMQIIQESLDRIVLNIVPTERFAQVTRTLLVDYFSDLFGSGVLIEINLVVEIKPEKSGKYRFAICKIYESNST